MESSEDIGTLERAEAMFESGQFESALELVRNLYGQTLPSSDRGAALALETVCLESLDRGEEADEIIAEVMKEEGDDLAFVHAAGMAFSDFGAFVHSEIFLRNLCDLDPENPVGWFNLAITLGREGRYPESIQAYDECIGLNQEFADAHFQKAFCFELMGDLDQAAATYRGYLERVPDDAEGWKALGIVESERKLDDAAYAAFSKAAALGGDSVEIYFNWAITAVRKNDIPQLETCIEKMQELDPDGWRTLLTQADYEEAQENIWHAWEVLCEAFDAVLDEEEDEEEDQEEDQEACGYVASALVRFSIRNDMGVHVGEYVNRIFEEGLYTEDVLLALLALDGRLSNAAKSYQVVLTASGDGAEGIVPGRYVAYGVAAENADEAGEIAIAFEAKYGPDVWELYSLQEITGPDEGHIGVYWRSEETTRPPEAD